MKMSRIADTKEVIITSDNTGQQWSIAAWDPCTASVLQTYKSATALRHHTVTVLSDSYVLGADLTKPRLHIWPLNSQCPVSNLRLTTPGKVTALSCTPNGAYIVAAVGEKLFIWQLCNGRLLAFLTRHYQTVTCLSFNKDGSIFASGGEDGLVFVWSLYRVLNDREPSPIHTFSDHSLPVKDLHFGHSGTHGRLCSVSLDRTAHVYEPSTGASLLTLVFDVPLTSVCMNIRESEMFVGCTDGTIWRMNLHEPPRSLEQHVRINGTENGNESAIYRGHKSTVVALSVSVNCRILLSGSSDGFVNIWDIASCQMLRTIEHKGPITSAFFTKRYENFRTANLKPKIQIRNLQRTSDEPGKDSFIEVNHRGRDTMGILDFDAYMGNNFTVEEQSSRPLDEAKEEIEKLKKINAAIYRYSVEAILGSSTDNG